jgi:ATP-dependent DNA ligase
LAELEAEFAALRGVSVGAYRDRLLEALVGRHPLIGLNPQVDDPADAAGWLEGTVPGIEGVVAKRATELYLPGARSWVKVKRRWSADVVVGGYRRQAVLLGLFDDHGLLHHIGTTIPLGTEQLSELIRSLPLLHWGGAFTGRPPGFGRWDHDRYSDWQEVVPRLVVEVSYT